MEGGGEESDWKLEQKSLYYYDMFARAYLFKLNFFLNCYFALFHIYILKDLFLLCEKLIFFTNKPSISEMKKK